MPYIPPSGIHTPAPGAIATAAWGVGVNEAANYLAFGKPRCRVGRNSNQSIPDATLTAIVFDTERYDVGAMHSTVSNANRVTIPSGEAGGYRVRACVQFEDHADGSRIVIIKVNGSLEIARNDRSPSASNLGPTISVDSGLIGLDEGDYVELLAYQNSGGALDALTNGFVAPEMDVVWEAA